MITTDEIPIVLLLCDLVTQDIAMREELSTHTINRIVAMQDRLLAFEEQQIRRTYRKH